MSTPEPQKPAEPPPGGAEESQTEQVHFPQPGVSFEKPSAPGFAPPHEQPTAPTYGTHTGLPYDPLPGQAYDPRTGLPLDPPPVSPYGPQSITPYNNPYGPPPTYPPPYLGGYPQPGYGMYPPPIRPTNGMAIASLVLGILWLYWVGSILALVFGYIARHQIAQRGQDGRAMATAGIVLGWIGVGTLILMFFFAFAVSLAPSPNY